MIKHFEDVDSFLKFGNGIEFSWKKYSNTIPYKLLEKTLTRIQAIFPIFFEIPKRNFSVPREMIEIIHLIPASFR